MAGIRHALFGPIGSMSNQPLIVAVISPERKMHEAIASALKGNPDVHTMWTLAEYPPPASLSEIRKATGGCVVFLDFVDPIRAKAVAAEIDYQYPMATAIAVHSSAQTQDLVELMKLGIREVVSSPVSASEVNGAFARVGRKLRTAGTGEARGGNLYAFLPSKPGVGATTLAAHGAAAAARLTNQHTLLIDFDFRLGMTSFLFKLDGPHSVVDAIVANAQLDSSLWDKFVCRRGMLDILGSAPVEFGGMDPESGALALVDFALESYQSICVDLPGEMREYEISTMHRAKECFLVTTPDIGALHMAKRKAEVLVSLGLQDKVSVILNQVAGRGSMPIRDLESILQLPVRLSVIFVPELISEATKAGVALEGKSPLVTQIENIARRMSPGETQSPGPNKRSFIEMFSVNRVRDRQRWGW